jgi:hypothetical protein
VVSAFFVSYLVYILRCSCKTYECEILYSHEDIIHFCFYTNHFFIKHMNFRVTWICTFTFCDELNWCLNM